MKMKKSIADMLEIFKANPNSRDTYAAYERKAKNWSFMDIKYFWDCALQDYPDNEYKELAQKIIACLEENELIEYEDILSDYIAWYQDNGAETDVGLTTHTITCIEDDYKELLEEYAGDEDEELKEQLRTEMEEEDMDEEKIERALWDFEGGPTTAMLNELKTIHFDCWYWEWLFRYCLRKSNVVENVIACFN